MPQAAAHSLIPVFDKFDKGNTKIVIGKIVRIDL